MIRDLGPVYAVVNGTFGVYIAKHLGSQIKFEASNSEPQGIICPGFFDIHIHGGNGIDFMSSPASEIVDWCDWLKNQGYEGFLPTTITAQAEEVLSAISKLPNHPMVKGFHLEGPFISPKFPGAQPPSCIALPPAGPSEWDPILNHPQLRVITMAPELIGAKSMINTLAQLGVKVGIGHTNATYEECLAAQLAGATHTTHTFNAMRGFHHREAGTAGFSLLNHDFHGELIYDRIHVCRESAQLLIENKHKESLIAISDGTMAAGLPAGKEITMWGLDCVVSDRDVRLKSGALAGSTITLLDAFQNISADFGIETAIRMTSLNPRKFLGISEPPSTHLFFNLDFQLVERLENSSS